MKSLQKEWINYLWRTERRGVRRTNLHCFWWVGGSRSRVQVSVVAILAQEQYCAWFWKNCAHGANTCWDAVVHDCGVCVRVGTTQRRTTTEIAIHLGCWRWWSPTSFGCCVGGWLGWGNLEVVRTCQACVAGSESQSGGCKGGCSLENYWFACWWASSR